MNFEELYKIIFERITSPKKDSYVANLVNSGKDRVLQKITEEAGEVVIACKNTDKNAQVSEIADLIFHILIAMNVERISIRDIENELERRTESK